jgi:hypothetical protein
MASFLISGTSRDYLELRKSQWGALEMCRDNVPSYVGDAGPDRYLKFQSSKHHADDGAVTACCKASTG